jgi:hypothetical protein
MPAIGTCGASGKSWKGRGRRKIGCEEWERVDWTSGLTSCGRSIVEESVKMVIHEVSERYRSMSRASNIASGCDLLSAC